jgi:SAM-dependent methyltransferase
MWASRRPLVVSIVAGHRASSRPHFNPFAAANVGARYAKGRPKVHPRIAAVIAQHVGRITWALDIGCGTGLSSRALLPYANRVIGMDPSPTMLAAASGGDDVLYVVGRGEALPFVDRRFELVTVGCAAHWCEPGALAFEMDRVLAPGGHLGMYDTELDDDTVREWLRQEYWSILPPCPRYTSISPVPVSYRLVQDTKIDVDLPMTLDEFVAFVTSQASSLYAIATGCASLFDLEARLRQGLMAHFSPLGRSMRFTNLLVVMRKPA